MVLTLTSTTGTEIGHRITGDSSFWAWTAKQIDVTYAPAPAETSPTETSTPPTASSSSKITSWRPPGSAPLTDADAASRVRAAAENRATNSTANAYRPSATELQTLQTERDVYGRTAVEFNPLLGKVTGNFTGTTDEIIQWGAWKWGIPEDWVRAQAAKESWWRMSQLGDRTTVVDPLRYPAYSRISGSSDVYQSLGLMQVRWDHPDRNKAGVGSEPLRWKSTAFNVDYALATVRYYFDGRCSWCGSGYAAGQEWESLAAWYNPYPWNNSGQLGYADSVRKLLADRVWEQAGF